MEFTSSTFWIFVGATFGLYYFVVPARFQPHLLILSSLCFYGYASTWLVLLLIFSIAISASSSYLVEYGKARLVTLFLASGVSLNLLILCVFKYSSLVVHTIFGEHPPESGFIQLLLSLPLPIGLSFYTFEGISLLVDSYRTRRQSGGTPLVPRAPLQHAATTSLFISFFPHLNAGPILKAHEFFPQIRPHSFRTIKWERAITELILGYFLKTVVGDNLQEYAAVIDAPIQHTPGYDLLAVLLCYTIQVFADFAGYSLVAIGLARLFGYELLPNFNFPFLSTSFKEFWTRWHISLSTWLREYLYFPLGGNKRGPLRTYFNLFIVMLLGGLWHGGTWNYAVWGGIHGSALAMERLCGNIPFRIQSRAFNALRGALVFATVAVALVFFRLPNIPSALRYLQTIYTNWIPVRTLVPFTALIFFALPVVVYHLLAYLREKYRWKLGPSFRPLILGLLLYLIVTNRGFPVTFIYFQF